MQTGLGVAQTDLGVMQTALGVAQIDLGAAQTRLGIARTKLRIPRIPLQIAEKWACQAASEFAIMRGTMTQDQDNIRTMFQTTLAFLDENNAPWSGTPAFADAVTRAQTGVEAIDTAADTQQTPTTGVTQDKAQARTDLEDQTLGLADQIAALAAKTGNHDLAAKVEVTKSSLDRMVDSDLEQTAERIGNLANDNITVLKTDYGVLGDGRHCTRYNTHNFCEY